MLRSGSRRSLLSAFQTVGPITANARRPCVSSCILGTTSRRRLAERRCCRSATWATGVHSSDSFSGGVTVKTLMHRHAELERDPICHIEPLQLSMMELSQTAVVFPCAAHHSRCSVHDSVIPDSQQQRRPPCTRPRDRLTFSRLEPQIPLSHLCGSSRSSTTAKNRREPQIYRVEREGTVLTVLIT